MTKFSSFFSKADVEKMTHRTSFGRCGIGDEIRRHVVYCRSEQVPLTSTTNLLCTLGDERPALLRSRVFSPRAEPSRVDRPARRASHCHCQEERDQPGQTLRSPGSAPHH